MDLISCCCLQIVILSTHLDANQVVEHIFGTTAPTALDASPAPASGMTLGAHRLNKLLSVTTTASSSGHCWPSVARRA